jgi:hypothetical protein
MIGRLPGTLEDRAVHVLMKRAMRGEVKRSFRPDRAGDLERLRSQAARFAADHMTALAAAEPELPPGAFNRFADNWRPLAALADLAGGRWPGRARAAILSDLGQAEEDELGHQLLEDIKAIFETLVDADGKTRPATKLASSMIVGTLKEMDDRPWNELGRSGVPITQNRLGRMLKDFRISSHGTIRLANGKTPKGYRRADFEDAWNRYLLPEEPNLTATPPQPAETLTYSLFATATNPENVAVEKRPKATETASCGGVAVENEHSARSRKNGADFEPTAAWQDAPAGVVWPPGCEFRLDMTTGRKQVRLAAEPWRDDPAESCNWSDDE